MTTVLTTTGDVRKARPADAAAIASTLAAAFTDDPVFHRILPDDAARPATMRTFLDLAVEILALHDDTWTTRPVSRGRRCGFRPGERRCPTSALTGSPPKWLSCARHTRTGSWSWSP
jgi:hypothetical protein